MTYLRTLPDSVDGKLLGEPAAWPDEPLAESLYGCGVSRLGAAGGGGTELGELLRTFPESASARRVGPAIDERIKDQVAAVKGAEPCEATEVLRGLGATASRLPDGSVKKLRTDADKGVVDGVYACGVDQFKDGKFGAARTTPAGFARTYKGDGRAGQARDIATAAEMAHDRPAAGKRLPPSQRPGGARMELVISNDAPNTVEVLYTGPVTGTVTLRACAGCERYSASEGPRRACGASGRSYPKARLRLPAGEYHFLYKHGTGATSRDGQLLLRDQGPAGLHLHQLHVRHRAQPVRPGPAAAPGSDPAGGQPLGRGFLSMTRPSSPAVRKAPPCESETYTRTTGRSSWKGDEGSTIT